MYYKLQHIKVIDRNHEAYGREGIVLSTSIDETFRINVQINEVIYCFSSTQIICVDELNKQHEKYMQSKECCSSEDVIRKVSDNQFQEPHKTFRKLGIIGIDGIITPNGVSIFLTYMLNKESGDFKNYLDYLDNK